MSLTILRPQVTEWEYHKNKWCHCKLCPLSHSRNTVVLARGQIPADFVLIGEAPGESEDSLGEPFVGPSGELLTDMLTEGLEEVRVWVEEEVRADAPVRRAPRLSITNTVGCIPYKVEEARTSIREPSKEEAKLCSPRLIEFIKLCSPIGIVCVGNVSKRFLPKKLPGSPVVHHILHPSYLLRKNEQEYPLIYKKWAASFVSILKTFYE